MDLSFTSEQQAIREAATGSLEGAVLVAMGADRPAEAEEIHAR